MLEKEMAVLKKKCDAHRFKKASSSSSDDDCDCKCDGEESSEESSESAAGCNCNCTDPCKAFNEAFAQRQLMKPALTDLHVVATEIPQLDRLDTSLQEAIMKSDTEEEICKNNKAAGKPCVRSFLEEVSCVRFKECWLDECQRLKDLCKKPEQIEPEVVADIENGQTFQPEIGKFTQPTESCCTHLNQANCKPCHHAKIDDFPSPAAPESSTSSSK
jgi:hypothetical protein